MRYTKRVEHFLILRLAIALAGFLLVQFWRESLRAPPSSAVGEWIAIVLGAYLLEAVGALAVLRYVARPRRFVAVQVAVDLSMVGAMVAMTGGAASLFCPLFFATVLAASTVIGLEGSILCSSAATGVLALASIVPHMVEGAPAGEGVANAWTIASCLLTYGLALHGVSLLSSRLVGGLADAVKLTEEIVETMGDGVMATDRRGAILLVNGAARKLLGLAPGIELEGKMLGNVLEGEALALVGTSLASSGGGTLKTTVAPPGVAPIPVEIRTTLLRGRKGAIRGTVLLLRDLTLLKRVDAAARRIAKLEEMTELARGMAHEVRNPLASMVGCAEEIARDPGVTGQTPRLVEILVREARRVDGMIDNFLDYARLRRLNRKTIDGGALIGNVGILLGARIADGRHRVVIDPPRDRLAFSGDADLLTQLLLNIGINALEALGPGEGEVRLGASAEPSPFFRDRAPAGPVEQGVEITVSDTGCGLSEEDRTKIFTPFYSNKSGGTGLGLTIAHRIARLHGGTIAVESNAGAGTTFRVWLPAALERDPVSAEAVWA